MSEPTARSRFLRRAWSIICSMGLPAAPGWLGIAFGWAEKAHLMNSLLDGTRFAGFLQSWWPLALGFIWLGALVAWEARKPPRADELDQVRKMNRLSDTIENVIARFEALSTEYEKLLSVAGAREVPYSRYKFLAATGEMLKAAIQTATPERRHEYKNMLMGVLLNHQEFYAAKPTSYSADASPTLPIKIALGMETVTNSSPSVGGEANADRPGG